MPRNIGTHPRGYCYFGSLELIWGGAGVQVGLAVDRGAGSADAGVARTQARRKSQIPVKHRG